jgi:single-strand DNA-binding protein
LVEGNLTRDPEIAYSAKGTAVCKFSVAVNRHDKTAEGEKREEVSYFDIVTFARLAEVCGEYLKKGRSVRVVGRLKQDRWMDADGKPHSRVVIIAEHCEFGAQPKDKADGASEPAVSTVPEATSGDIPF